MTDVIDLMTRMLRSMIKEQQSQAPTLAPGIRKYARSDQEIQDLTSEPNGEDGFITVVSFLENIDVPFLPSEEMKIGRQAAIIFKIWADDVPPKDVRVLINNKWCIINRYPRSILKLAVRDVQEAQEAGWRR